MRTDSGMDVAAAEIHGHLGPQAFSAMFVYDVSDPLALNVIFPTGVGGSTWVFARDLVLEAIETGRKVGEGDVAIEIINPGEMAVTLSANGQEATMHFALGEILAFITVTLQVVPQGAENLEAAIDAFLDSLQDL